jgi:hypothetical protein
MASRPTFGRDPLCAAHEALVLKIRAARVQMPTFQPEIRDLIARILTANVNSRYTIEQIKGHEAFRAGLPKDHQFPRLLPAPKIPASFF